jgi:spore germination protein GerM
MSAVRTVLLAALLLAVAAACGIPTDNEPRPVEAPPGPFPAFGSPTAAVVEPGAIAEPLCFVRDDKLVRTTRHINNAPTVYTQVAHLLAGPNDTERAAGLTTALTGTTTVDSIKLTGTQVTVELGADTDDARRSDELFAYGQIVCTITARPDVTSVRFTRNGQPIGIPRADGSLSKQPLTATDYQSLIAAG